MRTSKSMRAGGGAKERDVCTDVVKEGKSTPIAVRFKRRAARSERQEKENESLHDVGRKM